MKNNKLTLLILCFVLLLLASCSGKSDSGDASAEGESANDFGTSVSALGFSDSTGIKVFLLGEDGSSTQIEDQYHVEPGAKTLAVKVDGDLSTVDRVLVSDGAAYQVEALLENGQYVCSFSISGESLYQIILVEVVHSGGRASKEKLAVRTDNADIRGAYIRNSIGLTIGQDILDGQREGLADLLVERIDEVFDYIRDNESSLIPALHYGDNDAATRDVVVNSLEAAGPQAVSGSILRLNFTVKGVSLAALPLYGQNLISTQGNDLTIDTYISIKDTGSQSRVMLVLDFLGSAQVSFSQPFFLQDVVADVIASGFSRVELPPAAFDMGNSNSVLRDFLPDYITINGTDVDVDEMTGGFDINLEKYLFADMYGISDNPSVSSLAIGIGLCVQDYDEMVWESPGTTTPSEETEVDEVFNSMFQSTIDDVFAAVLEKNKGVVTSLSYGDGVAETRDFTINSLILQDTGNTNVRNANINFTVHDVDLTIVSELIWSTQDNDLTIDAVYTVAFDTGTNRIVIDVQEIHYVSFADAFDGCISPDLCLRKTLTEEKLKDELATMEEMSFGIGEITDEISRGLDITNALVSQDDYPAFPLFNPYLQIPSWDLGLIDDNNLRCAVSQDGINWLLHNALTHMPDMDAEDFLRALFGEDFLGFSSGSSQDEVTVMRLSVPPVVDLRTSKIRVTLPDVIIQYRLSGVPQWEASVDLDLIVTPTLAGQRLNFYLTPVEGHNHFHVMKDNKGDLGIFDHSAMIEDIVENLPEMLGNSASDPVFYVDTDNWNTGIVLGDETEPLKVSSGNGYLYIDMSAESVDLARYLKNI